MLQEVDSQSTRALQQSIKSYGTSPRSRRVVLCKDRFSDVSAINYHFADIASDTSFNDLEMQQIVSFLASNNDDSIIHLDDYDVQTTVSYLMNRAIVNLITYYIAYYYHYNFFNHCWYFIPKGL
jgi:hypothetical protein